MKSYDVKVRGKDLLSMRLQPSLTAYISPSTTYIYPMLTTSCPVLYDQDNSPTCGLVAIYMALIHQAMGDISIPSVHKKTGGNSYSILELAKKMRVTIFGAIYNIQYMKDIVTEMGFYSMAHISNRYSYHSDIIKALNSNYVVIVACDLSNTAKSFPGNSQGKKTHWAMIFKYFYTPENILLYWVAHHNNYYIWNGFELLNSNAQLPKENPRASRKPADSSKGTQKIPDDKSLEYFKYSMLFVPPQYKEKQALNYLPMPPSP